MQRRKAKQDQAMEKRPILKKLNLFLDNEYYTSRESFADIEIKINEIIDRINNNEHF